MNTVKDLHPAIGQVVGMRLESLVVPVIVRDVKTSWGVVRFLVSPQFGTGEQWCEISRLTKFEHGVNPCNRLED